MKDKRIDNYMLYDGTRPYIAIDFTIECNPSLKTKSHTEIGVKKYTDYLGINDELVVKKTFIEDYTNKKIDILFEWFNVDGTIFTSKTKEVYLEDSQWFTRYEKQRKVAFNDLKAQVTEQGYGQYVDILYAYFKEELQDYYETGSGFFTQRVHEVRNTDVSGLAPNDIVTIVHTILNNKLGVSNEFVWEELVIVMT